MEERRSATLGRIVLSYTARRGPTLMSAERVAALGRDIAATTRTVALTSADDDRRDGEYLAASAWRYAATIDAIEQARARPLRDASVLDVGAYPGHLAAYLRQSHGAHVTAVTLVTSDDFDHRMRAAGVATAVCDVERDRLPAATGTVDVVLCSEVIEHLDGDVMHVLREARRVVRDDGVLLLTTPNHASVEHRWALLRGRSVYPPLDLADYPFSAGAGVRNPMRHVREFTVAEITALLEAAGFGRVAASTTSPPWRDGAGLSRRGRIAVRLQQLAQRLLDHGGTLIVAAARP
jgi:SAM-dependent methyltransferase